VLDSLRYRVNSTIIQVTPQKEVEMSQIVLLSIQENKEEEIVYMALIMKSPEKSRIIWEIDIPETRIPRPRYGQFTVNILNKLHDMECKLLATHPHTSPRHTPYQDYLYYHDFFLEVPDDFDPGSVK